MKTDRIRVSLEITKELSIKLKEEAIKKDISINALIRLALIEYLNKVNN